MADQVYRARIVMPMSSPIIENGALVLRDGKIIALGSAVDLLKNYSSAIAHDLGEVILLPGLINAHCHLEYGMMRHRITPKNNFTEWIQEIVEIKASLNERDFLTAIGEGAKELLSWGCTTVVNNASFPRLLLQLPKLPLRCWHLLEVMDIRGQKQGDDFLKAVECFFQQDVNNSNGGFGIAPHAPQTASKKLYAAARDLAQKHEILFSTHLAESKEEVSMFAKQSGSLFEFLKSLGRNMDDCGFETPLQALLSNDLLPKGAMLIHMNFLNHEDRLLLGTRGDDFSIVHCPGTHQFFKREPFDYPFFKEHGFSISLGTDSLASNQELNLFYEMQTMAAAFPELGPEEILHMVTLNPAVAIGCKGKLGELSVGAYADMIAIPFDGALNEASAAVVNNKILPDLFFG